EIDIAGRGVFWKTRALWLLVLRIVLLLAELDIGPEAAGLYDDVAVGFRILAEHTIRARLGVRGEGTGVAAFRIVRAADKGAELAGFQVQPAGAAGRALPHVAAIRARRIDVRTQHLIECIQHLGDAEVLDVVDGADEVAPEILQHLLPGN